MVFDNEPQSMFYLDQYIDKKELIAEISLVPYLGGYTNTQAGLKLVRDELFTYDHGDRDDWPNVLVVITDGESNINNVNTIPSAQKLHNDGVKIISIGITNDVNIEELKSLSSEPRRENYDWFQTNNFAVLNTIQDTIASTVHIINVCPPSSKSVVKYKLSVLACAI